MNLSQPSGPVASSGSAPAAFVLGGEARLNGAIREALGRDGADCVSAMPERLDILVFIATGGGPRGFAGVSADAWCGQVGGELKAAFLAVRQAAAAIRAKGGGGSIVIIAPAGTDHRSYDALQQGLRLLVRAAALELGPEDIRVNIVLPGAGETPLGRACSPEDVAASVAFVASPRARFMTGADLVVDGGRLAE